MNKDLILKILGLSFDSKWESQMMDWSYLLVRVGTALMMFFSHGYGKLMNFSNIAPHFSNPLGLGSTLSLLLVTGAEFFGALLLALGLLTRWSSFSLLFTMLVAAFIVHLTDPFKAKELAIAYALLFLLFTIYGGGKYSLDSLLKKKL